MGKDSESRMKGIWIGEDDEFGLRYGKEYEFVGYSEAFDSYGVVDETGIYYGYAYLYPRELFVITEPLPEPPLRKEESVNWDEIDRSTEDSFRNGRKQRTLEYLNYQCGGYLSFTEKLIIVNHEGKLELDGFIFPGSRKNTSAMHSHDLWSTERSWRWLQKMKAIQFENWEDEYSRPEICDGTQWSLRYKYSGEDARHIRGSNDYPENWNAFTKLMRDIMKRLPKTKDDNHEAILRAWCRAENECCSKRPFC